jgi:hypothetical protein
MNPSIAFEAAKGSIESLDPATDPLLFAASAALVLAASLLLLLGGRVHRGTAAVLRKADDLISAREARGGAGDA